MSKSKIRTDILDEEWTYCLGLSREARYLILGNSESFHEAATALEQIGKVLCGCCCSGLAGYVPALLDLGQRTGRHQRDEIERLFNVIRDARNDAVHTGAWARHLSDRMLDLFLILEEADSNC
jgi:hypothetical protein